jgi:uncharacterized protein (DUF697 family)
MADQAIAHDLEVEPRVAEAMEIVRRNMLWSAGAGFIPFPLLDFAAITAVEVKLMKELADHYEQPYSKDVAKGVALSLVGGLGSVTLGKMAALSSLRIIPALGPVVAAAAVPGVSAAITYAVGKVVIAHFEAGGTLLNFNPRKMRDYFRAQYAEGLKEAAATATGSRKASSAA